MKLTSEEKDMLDGGWGKATRKAMEILCALGSIYNADHMVPVASVQIAGVSFDNLGEAGLAFLDEMAEGGGKVQVLATLNPAGMDVENWQALEISADFARDQERVLAAFARMGVITTCSCTPYLSGNLPHFREHIAWAESSAVCFANSVIGARTNREGGPSALAAALTGRTPCYGYHLDENRRPTLAVTVEATLDDNSDFGALGVAIGRALESRGLKPVPYIRGLPGASLENLKSFCASLATYGGAALFHIEGITPEASVMKEPDEIITVGQLELERVRQSLNDATSNEVDFVSLGCPHLSIKELARVAFLLQGKKVTRRFWITTSRPTKDMAARMGYVQVIEEAGGIIAADTCCVVAPIKGRFNALATDSAKACYYASSKNNFKTRFLSFDEVVAEALR